MTGRIEVRWETGQHTVSWDFAGVRVERSFEPPPVSVAVWHDPPCVIVVEEMVEGARLDNAVVLAPDGSEQLRLVPPAVVDDPSLALGFYAVYPSAGFLTAVFSTRVGDFWGKPDLTNGQLTDIAQWR